MAESFAKAKYFLEELFFSVTKKGELFYTYHSGSLLNSAELQKELGVSRATISRYVQQGMEVIPKTGHKRYPLHNTFYWKNGIWAAQLQVQQERYRIRNQTMEQLIEELQAEVLAFETAYKGTFEEVFGDIQDPYQLSKPDDYFDWHDAIEELKRIDD
ncbi:MerR family transcriptional regulator [Planococcus lenghuensis]|uniref:Uncharacterized protein n=1 Tax=Planococcus lenghuensis TaxID=2213202 RepID=A0A1Q2KVX5_9BACL|nr:hypothetical protein [Planococcus lenghuensis]AQQ52264.1 hypothetical protein B0X71_03475 [Planococcus lenghuensis]